MGIQGLRPLVLASSSPRRIELLSMMGLEFEVIPARIREDREVDPITTARKLSRKKALHVWRKRKDALVIGADTLVYMDGKVFGKPSSPEDAYRILSSLSGRWHRVVTAVSLVGLGVRITFHDVTRVKFRRLSEGDIREYIATGDPMDKAGAYGVQGIGSTIVERIEGSFYTVMGLPVHRLYRELKRLSTL